MNAEQRAWEVVRRAYEERVPSPPPRRPRNRVVLAVGCAAVVVAAVLSPPGRAVLGSLREAVGVEHAQTALFSLPAPGRLLVTSPGGAWVVHADGSKRRLGDYADASWSPHGLFVVAARSDEVAAVEPDGSVHWTLDRPRVAFPRWGGSRTDTRVAYLTGRRLHVVGGDGTRDVDQGGEPDAAHVAPAWRPGARHVLAYATTRGRVYVLDTDAGSLLWRSAPFRGPRALAWSADGSRLALVTRDRVVIFGGGAKPLAVRTLRGVVGAAFAPRGNRLALVRARDVLLLAAPRARPVRLFAGTGAFTGVAWSADGRWLLVPWRDADQWVFLRVAGARRIRAVSNVSRQFGGFPRIATWVK